MDVREKLIDLKQCSICMDGAPYRFCCKRECGEHEFCRGCTWNRRAGEEDKHEDYRC